VAISTFNKVLLFLAAFVAALFVVAWFYFSATAPDDSLVPSLTPPRTSSGALSMAPTPLLTRFTDADDSMQVKGVPFTSQAPFGNWSDPRQQDGCEEASVLMAVHWFRGETFTLKEAEAEILKISDWELQKYGTYHDTSPADTVTRLIKDYFKYQNAEAVEGISLVDMKNELRKGNLVLVQVDGRALKNPNYTTPGPERHMMVVTGYDAAAQEFITNDPGTRKGENYRYGEYKLWQAMRDYPTGDHLPINEIKKSMIIVSPEA